MVLPHLTMLNVMAGFEYSAALQQSVDWGIRVLDLKDCIFGKGIADLTREEAMRAKEMAREKDLSVYCLSSVLFHSEIEAGEEEFLALHWPGVERIIEVASVMQPRVIRLLAAQTRARRDTPDSIDYLRREHPWVFNAYRRAIDRISDAGYAVAIENEVGNCILSTPAEVQGFFAAIDRPDRVKLIWGIQNLWSMGTFPTLGVYETLKPLFCSMHLKGGRCEGESGPLKWASALEDASWPVAEITRRAVADGAIESICLNPSHGQRPEGFDGLQVTCRDLAYVRSILKESGQ